MKKPKGWYSWSNSIITLYYIDQDRGDFELYLRKHEMRGMISASVAVKDNEDGIMGRTVYGREVSQHPIRSELDLTSLCKRLRQ